MLDLKNVTQLEMQEIIKKLVDNGYGDYVDCLLSHDTKCFTKKSRLNKSATCRAMNVKNKDLEKAMQEMRELLKNEFPDFFIKD